MAETVAAHPGPRSMTPGHPHQARLSDRTPFFDHLRRSIERNDGVVGGLAVLSVTPDPLTFADGYGSWERRQEICLVAAGWIVGCLHYSDLVTRTTTDQFLVLAEGVGVEGAIELAERLRAAVRWPETSGGEALWVTASIGIAFQEPHATVEQLHDNATLAMHSARSQGGDRYQLYGEWLREAATTTIRVG